jgi:predicted lipid carrier protein YhbT
VTQYLTQEWLDQGRKLAKGLPKRPGVSAKVQYVVGGAPDGDVKYSWVLQDGKLLESRLGVLEDAEVTLTLPYAESVAIAQGELDPNVAFMQGRMKVAGDTGKVLQLLPLTRSPEYVAFQDALRGLTTY